MCTILGMYGGRVSKWDCSHENRNAGSFVRLLAMILSYDFSV